MTAGSLGANNLNGVSPLPPAVTQWNIEPGSDQGAAPAPPFVTGGTAVPAANRLAATESPSEAAAPALEQYTQAVPETEPLPDDTDELPWESMSDEGVVEPVFAEDVASTTESMLALTNEPEGEAFPVNAFIIPEDSRRVPTGLDQGTVNSVKQHAEHTTGDPTQDLADRFEKLSRRLRAEDLDTLLPSLARGDRFDAMLAGFLAGYFSARES